MSVQIGLEVIRSWPQDAREPAQLVIDKYGEPDEATETFVAQGRTMEAHHSVQSSPLA